jgi:hypothetical protein
VFVGVTTVTTNGGCHGGGSEERESDSDKMHFGGFWT